MCATRDTDDLPDLDELEELPPDGGTEYNRLVFEKSPYLLQHATNPVDWRPWNEEARRKAREEDKPIFLSIGYSTCRWCHVMERESFENEEVADILNERFVPIKVDREERPDLDQVYMTACQALTGRGGWPLNVVLTPEGEPFFATTYLPPEGRAGRAGLKNVLRRLADLWEQDRERVLDSAGDISNVLRSSTGGDAGVMDESMLEETARQLSERYDRQQGGFGTSPKFPSPHNLLFLLRWWNRCNDDDVLNMVSGSLNAMRLGGIYDHVGFGFHRYSTDREWLLPHFEKMLYDQAMHMAAFAEASLATGQPRFGRTAGEIAAYLRRDMKSPEGAFYSAEDAESEGEEGKFYVWSRDEWMEVLGEEDGRLFGEIFNIREDGNYQDEATGRRTGANIPHLSRPLAEEACARDIEPERLRERWDSARQRLLSARSKRVRPHRDDKIVTAWNGLLIASLSTAFMALQEEQLRDEAGRAADFVLGSLCRRDGRLLRYHRRAAADVPGFADDYAFLVWGLLNLYEAGLDVGYLEKALDLTVRMVDLFWDEERGGFSMVGEDAEQPVVRPREVQDGALPSSNSVALLNLQRLALLTGREDLREYGERLIDALAGEVARYPAGHAQFMCGLDFALGPQQEVVVAGDPQAEATRRLCEAVHLEFLPRSILVLHPPDGAGADRLEELAGYTEKMVPRDGRPVAYVCEDYTCREPVSAPNELRRALHEGK
jgi:hypothetical protein